MSTRVTLPRPTAVPRRSTFRHDINGLRSVAIIPVVLIHAGVLAVPGGFIGVDIFFVISGFLITGHLMREASSAGRVRLLDFWSRRLRRLFPVLAVVTVATMAAASLIFSPLEFQALAVQAFASLVSVSNILFARESTDYFGGEFQQSPFLHTWSLGVEEQFYLFLPVLVIVVWWIAARSRFSGKTVLTASLVLAFTVSLAASVLLTTGHPFWAFYTLPTRVWEFAAGGLLALWAPRLPRLPAAVMTWLGIAILIAGMLLITERDPFPGALALVPVVGTLLVLASGEANSLPSRILATRPMQWIGTRSYSWYLWHWPVMVLSTAALGTKSLVVGLVAAVVSLGLAVITYRLVETPFRFHPKLTSSTKRTYAFVGALLALSSLAGGVIVVAGAVGSATVNHRPWHAAHQEGAPESCPEILETASGLSYCAAGNLDSATVVLIVGDSHAAQWVPTLASVAEKDGFQLAISSLVACPAVPVSVSKGLVRYEACDALHSATSALIADLRPDVVITSHANSYLGMILDESGSVPPAADQARIWASGYKDLVEHARDAGSIVAAIEDNPRPAGDPAICVTRPGGTVDACTPSRSEALADVSRLLTAEQAVRSDLAVSNVHSIVRNLCDDDVCIIVEDGIPVYADANHVSQRWAGTQADRLSEFVKKALAST